MLEFNYIPEPKHKIFGAQYVTPMSYEPQPFICLSVVAKEFLSETANPRLTISLQKLKTLDQSIFSVVFRMSALNWVIIHTKFKCQFLLMFCKLNPCHMCLKLKDIFWSHRSLWANYRHCSMTLVYGQVWTT